MIAVCPYCKKEFEVSVGHYNRAKKVGLNLYCSRECSGKGRRSKKTVDEKKADKSKYDKEYREKNIQLIKDKKRAYFAQDYAKNPEKYSEQRRKRYPKHLEYLRRPEYREYKKEYDEQYRAEKLYGEFAEAAIILKKIEQSIDSHQARIDKDCHLKKKKRSKLCNDKTQKNLPQLT